jgi:hypothetical protein
LPLDKDLSWTSRKFPEVPYKFPIIGERLSTLNTP